jgi:hypothetical protein
MKRKKQQSNYAVLRITHSRDELKLIQELNRLTNATQRTKEQQLAQQHYYNTGYTIEEEEAVSGPLEQRLLVADIKRRS